MAKSGIISGAPGPRPSAITTTACYLSTTVNTCPLTFPSSPRDVTGCLSTLSGSGTWGNIRSCIAAAILKPTPPTLSYASHQPYSIWVCFIPAVSYTMHMWTQHPACGPLDAIGMCSAQPNGAPILATTCKWFCKINSNKDPNRCTNISASSCWMLIFEGVCMLK